MKTWMLEGYSTEDASDVRYRNYTTSRYRKEKFEAIPKIQYTDSGHGIVFHAVEFTPARGKKRPPVIRIIADHVDRHMGMWKR